MTCTHNVSVGAGPSVLKLPLSHCFFSFVASESSFFVGQFWIYFVVLVSFSSDAS
ncbi:hypothetical protein RhiirB3_532660 [Rhizophagus irregularis]|nr:hypothetical protein RhiirB3_532660 [Rhizophagus irregularis]